MHEQACRRSSATRGKSTACLYEAYRFDSLPGLLSGERYPDLLKHLISDKRSHTESPSALLQVARSPPDLRKATRISPYLVAFLTSITTSII